MKLVKLVTKNDKFINTRVKMSTTKRMGFVVKGRERRILMQEK